MTKHEIHCELRVRGILIVEHLVTEWNPQLSCSTTRLKTWTGWTTRLLCRENFSPMEQNLLPAWTWRDQIRKCIVKEDKDFCPFCRLLNAPLYIHISPYTRNGQKSIGPSWETCGKCFCKWYTTNHQLKNAGMLASFWVVNYPCRFHQKSLPPQKGHTHNCRKKHPASFRTVPACHMFFFQEEKLSLPDVNAIIALYIYLSK